MINDTKYDDKVRITNQSIWIKKESPISRPNNNFRSLDKLQLGVERANIGNALRNVKKKSKKNQDLSNYRFATLTSKVCYNYRRKNMNKR